jgi:hypothetical protein
MSTKGYDHLLEVRTSLSGRTATAAARPIRRSIGGKTKLPGMNPLVLLRRSRHG